MSTAIDLWIRDVRFEEREAAVELTIEAYKQYEQGFSPEFWENYKNSMRVLWSGEQVVDRIIAVQDGKLVGALLLFPANFLLEKINVKLPYPELRLLAVDTSARGKGVATALIRECALRAEKRGAPYLGLHTTERMASARKLYQRLGFQRVTEFDFPGEDKQTVVEAYRLPLGGELGF
ncbi:GNAT family N-acetyltransferase [Paenibacillus sp. N3.4]|uniref:GNAT family N-acetyltransferase n=1 Tax=Paenibacillus sp. N3.4 TaxID=2603222 RepID=UPI0011CB7E97|nr:GNAT family N-acetyltransferase [Paenibacillus sp. N3.4]TXK77503.1 GNAT family N-acetyltransferase [Paenibacillus sp. N3.4]